MKSIFLFRLIFSKFSSIVEILNLVELHILTTRINLKLIECDTQESIKIVCSYCSEKKRKYDDSTNDLMLNELNAESRYKIRKNFRINTKACNFRLIYQYNSKSDIYVFKNLTIHNHGPKSNEFVSNFIFLGFYYGFEKYQILFTYINSNNFSLV